jgi:hypothetical protein
MRRLQSLLLIFAMWPTGCNGVVFFGTGFFHPPNTLVTVNGFVSVIQITTIISSGGTATFVTVVTFLQSGTASTINFCGNVGNQFVANALLRWISPKARAAPRWLQCRPASRTHFCGPSQALEDTTAAAKACWSWTASSQPAWSTEDVYSLKIQPLLAGVSTSAIASKIGVSRWYAGRIRQGYRPHPRHWQALAELVGVSFGV